MIYTHVYFRWCGGKPENFQQATKGQVQGEMNFIKKKIKLFNKWKKSNGRNGKIAFVIATKLTVPVIVVLIMHLIIFILETVIVSYCNRKGHLTKVCYFNENKTVKSQPRILHFSNSINTY